MGRSFWKGKAFIQDFVGIPVVLDHHHKRKATLFKQTAPISMLSTTKKVYRRNHTFLNSQFATLSSIFPCEMYNGYDFLVQSLPNSILELNSNQQGYTTPINLGARALTRERSVVHKAKVTKAMRKKSALRKPALNKKKTTVGRSSSPMRKSALTKYFKK